MFRPRGRLCPEIKEMTQRQQDAYEDPLAVETYEGEVVITGPGRIGVSLTASAAAQTARRLAAAAVEAQKTWKPQALPTIQPVTNAPQDSSAED